MKEIEKDEIVLEVPEDGDRQGETIEDQSKKMPVSSRERADRCWKRIERWEQEILDIKKFLDTCDYLMDLPRAVRNALYNAEGHLNDRIELNRGLAETFEKHHRDELIEADLADLAEGKNLND